MSQTKTKKLSTPWVQCDKCLIHVLNKDVESHSKDCPPNLKNIFYNFLKDEILYGTIDAKTNEDIKNISSREKDNLVFLSKPVIQLCSFAIGDWAIVRMLDSGAPPVVRMVWPTVEKSLTSVLFTKNGLDLSFEEVGKNVVVSKVSGHICSASRITLIVLNGPKSLEITSELYNRVSKSYTDRIFTVGNKISVMFYGKILKFEVKSIETSEKEINLENNFSRLCIEDQHEFYRTSEATKWTVYRNQEHYAMEVLEEETVMIAGLDKEMQEICELMNAALGKRKLSNLAQSRAVLLYGNSGTGKTTLAKILGKMSKANVVAINAPDLYSKYSGSAEETIKELFQDAIDHSPSIIIIDEIDILCPLRSSRITDTEKRIVSTLLVMFDNLNAQTNIKVFIIATTNKPDNIDPAFRRCGRLDREIEIPTPNPKSRKAVLTTLLKNACSSLSEDQLQEISANTHGFVGADLVSLCSRASLNASQRGNESLTIEDFKFALKRVRPSAMREVQIEVPNVKWVDIGGQENLKLILRQAVEWPLKHPDSFIRLGITPPRGVLMFGPPGCSKTMIAKALATESGLNFLSIKGPELFSKWVGESEKAVREVFRKARQVAPSIIFFDEIDAIGGERSSGTSTSVQERVLAQLLTELDGVTPLGDVTILAATNRPDRIDKALLRPGRLDRIVYVPLPDADTRREIFRIKLSRMPVLNVDIEDLVKKTECYSGAEVNAVCHEAAMKALEESLEIQHVEGRHFKNALKLITPRTPPSLIKLYEDYLQIKI
ncbi:spermatogenesis-associated protein 5 [Anoplophora glabripennis]|uniref:spermatogenesis-associated protein 5 n=1 Tax=Anoplophora glabripennis TaxID=217634 RepID=UPI000875231A|nr:spermatogenesis-associated protein 5 [Anoplophora glabripennis]